MSDGKKNPAMLLYGEDFYSDEAVRLMSLEQEAIYMRLLWHAWREGSIPAGVEDLAALVDVPVKRFKKLWPLIAKKWVPAHGEAGRLVNKRQEQERKRLAERARRLSENGRNGNEKRWGKESPGDRQGVARNSPGDRTTVANSSLPSPSPSDDDDDDDSRPSGRDPEPDPSDPSGSAVSPDPRARRLLDGLAGRFRG